MASSKAIQRALLTNVRYQPTAAKPGPSHDRSGRITGVEHAASHEPDQPFSGGRCDTARFVRCSTYLGSSTTALVAVSRFPMDRIPATTSTHVASTVTDGRAGLR